MEQITQYLRDSLWQSIGVFITLGTTFWLTSRNKKMLSYEVISKNQLLSVDEQVAGKLRIFYEDQPTQDLCLLVIKLSNSGNTAISAKDFEEKITLSTGENSKILSVTVIEKIPENLSEKISLFNSYLTIEPLLLNSKDSLTIQLLVSDFSGRISVKGRILGVKEIKELKVSSFQDMNLLLGVSLASLGQMIGLAYRTKATPPPPLGALIGEMISFAGVILAVTSILYYSDSLNKLRRLLGKS
jgi:hypothetical protein